MAHENEAVLVARRDVLKTVGMGAAIGALGLGTVRTVSGPAGAQATVVEALYLSDSGGNNAAFDGETRLYSVALNSSTGGNSGDLTLLETLPPAFGQVDAIAARADGKVIFF